MNFPAEKRRRTYYAHARQIKLARPALRDIAFPRPYPRPLCRASVLSFTRVFSLFPAFPRFALKSNFFGVLRRNRKTAVSPKKFRLRFMRQLRQTLAFNDIQLRLRRDKSQQTRF